MANRYAERVRQRADVAKEFLVVVVGLALSGGIIERGFHDLWNEQTGNYDITPEVWALAVYIVYACRFFINNWLYLSSSYNEDHLTSLRLGNHPNIYRWMMTRVTIDMILNIYTGVIVSIISIFHKYQQGKWLFFFLMAHLFVDIFATLVTIVFSRQNDEKDRIRGLFWILNNFGFFILLCFEYHAANKEDVYYFILEAWFVNCILAMLITIFSQQITNIVNRLKNFSARSAPQHPA